MRDLRITNVLMTVAILCFAGSLAGQQVEDGELFPPYTPPRTEHDTPDLSGIWQSFTTANWNILSHPVQSGPFVEMLGAWGAGRAGFG